VGKYLCIYHRVSKYHLGYLVKGFNSIAPVEALFMPGPRVSARKSPIQPAHLQTNTTKVYTYRI